MSELISRQDAIDAIELSMTAFVFDEMTIKEVLKEIADNTKEIAISRIKHLPSADTVSREEYEELYHNAEEVNRMANEILVDFPSYKELVSAVPNCQRCAIKELWEETEKEDLVSVVRCMDCKNWRESHSEDEESYCYIDGRTTDSMGYCSWGERRNNE